MLTQEERFYREGEYKEAFQEKIDALRAENPHHEYEILNQLAALLYPRLFQASVGQFDDDFNVKEYSEPEQPEFETADEELAHRAKIYSLRKTVDYETAAGVILDVDKELAERYKMS